MVFQRRVRAVGGSFRAWGTLLRSSEVPKIVAPGCGTFQGTGIMALTLSRPVPLYIHLRYLFLFLFLFHLPQPPPRPPRPSAFTSTATRRLLPTRSQLCTKLLPYWALCTKAHTAGPCMLSGYLRPSPAPLPPPPSALYHEYISIPDAAPSKVNRAKRIRM